MSTWNRGVPEPKKMSGSLIVGSGKVAKRTAAALLAGDDSDEEPVISYATLPNSSPSMRSGSPITPPVAPSFSSRTETEALSNKPVCLSYKVREQKGGLFYPELDEHFYVNSKHSTYLDVVQSMSESNPKNVLLIGPQGCGKSELAIWFAAKYKRPAIIMNCAVIREAKDWFGFRDAKSGSLFWHKSEFVKAVEMGGVAILLDEFNRLPTTLHNSLYPLLDARRATFVEDLEETIKVGPGTVFFATANIGVQHTGTFTIDSSMEDRWGARIDVSFLDSQKEAEIIVKKTGLPASWAGKLTTLASKVRAKANDSNEATLSRAVSTRQLLECAETMRHYLAKGLDPSSVFDYHIVPFFSKDGGTSSEQAQVLQIIQGIFGGRNR